MGASRPESPPRAATGDPRRALRWWLLSLLLGLSPWSLAAQIEAEPVLEGRVLLGGGTLGAGTVVLHVLGDRVQAEVDSTVVRSDGSFTLRLPSVPDPSSGEFYFASVRHSGVMYFGPPVASAVQLDTLYQIQAYDTLLAPAEGVQIALEARNIFFEQGPDAWQVTDLFQLRSDRDRTLVPRDGGRTWSYPLPVGAREVSTGEGELSAEVVTYEPPDLVVRAALPPGERFFVVRYLLDSPEVSIPTPGETEMMDLLVREPAPPFEVEGLLRTESVELDPGETYRRYSGENVAVPALRVAMGEDEEPLPVHWIAVILAVVLAGGGLVALRGGGRSGAVAGGGRQSILMQLARLDEDFENVGSPSRAQRRTYQNRRAELMRLLRSGD